MRNETITLICMIELIMISFLVGFIYKEYITNDNFYLSDININNKDFLINCSGLDLTNTSLCMNEYVKTFFVYNLSKSGKQISFNELNNEGGVCSHYSEFYKSFAEGLGYNASTQNIRYFNNSSNISYAHEFVTVFNEEGYCVLDQTMLVGCVYLNLTKTKYLKRPLY